MYPSMRRCFGGRYPRSAHRTSFCAGACPGGTLYSEWKSFSSDVTRCRSALFGTGVPMVSSRRLLGMGVRQPDRECRRGFATGGRSSSRPDRVAGSNCSSVDAFASVRRAVVRARASLWISPPAPPHLSRKKRSTPPQFPSPKFPRNSVTEMPYGRIRFARRIHVRFYAVISAAGKPFPRDPELGAVPTADGPPRFGHLARSRRAARRGDPTLDR